MPAQKFVVDDTTYEFPDNYTEDQVKGILTKQGIIKPPAQPQTFGQKALEFGGDVLKGVGAEAIGGIVGGGDLIRRATGMQRIKDKPEVKELTTPPASLGGKIGSMAEPVAETLAMPEMKATEVPKLLKTGATVMRETLPSLARRAGFEGLKMGTQAAVHGDDPAAGAILGMSGPVLGNLLQRAAPAVRGSANWLYEKALNPTTKITKSEARDVVPELLKRKFWATTFPRLQGQAEKELGDAETRLESAFDKAVDESKKTYTPTGRYRTVKTPGTSASGPVIDVYATESAPAGAARLQQTTQVGRPTGNVGTPQAAEAGGSTGTTERVYETARNALDLKPVMDNLRGMMQDYSVKGIRPTTQADMAYKQIQSQYQKLSQFGRYIGLEDARKLRQILDKPLGEKGLFALDPKWASLDRVQKRAADALRNQINTNFPELARENAEYSLWRNVNHVIDETTKRKIGQTGLITALAGAGTIAADAAAGKDVPDTLRDAVLIGGVAALTRSPGFRTLSAVKLNQLANLIQARDVEGFIRAAGTMVRPKATAGSAAMESPHLQ